MMDKTNNQFLFEVQLDWLSDKKGTISAKDAAGNLLVATPPKFGEEGKPWTPEHYFLSAISGCFMTTYLAFADKLGFEISNFECNAIGQISMVNGKYKFVKINLYPRVYVASDSLLEKAKSAVEKTLKYCLITNSLNADVLYHSEVLVDPKILKVA